MVNSYLVKYLLNMRLLNYFFFIFILLITNQLKADDRDKELNKLFKELKTNNKDITYNIEQKIWSIWSTHPTDNKLTLRLAEGSKLVINKQLLKAIEIFTEVINKDPNWAEAWNKRATVLYLMGKYELSQADIDKVLQLEKRHFGALSGQGLVQSALKNYQKAIDSYIEAHKVHPNMKSPLIMIEQLQMQIKKESI